MHFIDISNHGNCSWMLSTARRFPAYMHFLVEQFSEFATRRFRTLAVPFTLPGSPATCTFDSSALENYSLAEAISRTINRRGSPRLRKAQVATPLRRLKCTLIIVIFTWKCNVQRFSLMTHALPTSLIGVTHFNTCTCSV